MQTTNSVGQRIVASLICVFLAHPALGGSIWYVDTTAPGSNSGTSWFNAFRDLQDALSAAQSGDQILVAQGTYVPSHRTEAADPRTATFELMDGVGLYGGFPVGGGGWEQRDPVANETTLTGDIGVAGVDGDNCYHVVTTDHTGATTVLDGFVITAGNADGIGKEDWGGGMYNYQSSVSVANCIFRHNTAARRAGGMYNKQSSPTVTSCVFTENADSRGGGMYNQASYPIVTDCTFSGNRAFENGGGICNGSRSNVTVFNCTFIDNMAQGDGGGVYNYEDSGGTFVGCRFVRNSANGNGGGLWNDSSSLVLRDCTFSKNVAGNKGGGIYFYYCDTAIDGCTLSFNKPDGLWVEGGIARILGTVRAVANDLAGMGSAHIVAGAVLSLDKCFVLCSLSGLGRIEVDPDSELVIGGDAIIDLGDPNDPNANGEIGGGSILRVEGNATIGRAKIKLSRGSFDDNAVIYDSVIIVDDNAPYGQVFMDPNVSIINCDIYVSGDRYMDMQPWRFGGVFENNRIYVTITDDTAVGALFELRGKDGLVENSCEPNLFMCPVDPCVIPDCNIDSWTIERLELVRGAKVNLTNRFPFQPPYDPGTDDDVLYVKAIVLRENAVFNTAYNRVYYGHLETEPNAVITDVPLLGFSLINITFDDNIEYLVRVTHNNYEDPEDPNFDREHASRVEGDEPDPNGMMVLRNIVDSDPNSPNVGETKNAQAKGLFAKAGDNEDYIRVTFEYQFVEDPCNQAELAVYLSDEPEVDVNLVEVARVRPPVPNRPGSLGSDSFAVFSGNFPRGSLNFYRGTYVGVELRGAGAVCRINNLDPQVNCVAICGDYYQDIFNIVNVSDYLVLLAEFGLTDPAGVGKGCLDLVTDGCVNNCDLMAWGIDEVLNKCPLSASASASGSMLLSKSLPSVMDAGIQSVGDSPSLFLCGKVRTGVGTYVPDSYMFGIDSNGTCVGDPNDVEGDGRLVVDGEGSIYQINGNLGLVRRDTGEVVVAPQAVYHDSNLVRIGFDGEQGVLLADAAFKRDDANIVYIAPVQVDPQDGNCPYMAAAKLQLTGAGAFSLLRLYGKNPATDPCQSTILTCCDGDLVYEPDVQHLDEIEIDPYGNLFVLSAHLYNANNWILIYDEGVGNSSELRIALTDPNLIGPTGMVVSTFDDRLYLASSTSTSTDLTTEIYRFSITRTGEDVTGITYDESVDVNCPAPAICTTTPSVCDAGLGYSTSITSMATSRRDGSLYVTGFTAPRFSDVAKLPSQVTEIFTTPMLAVIPADSNGPVEAVEIAGCDVALPFSVVSTALEDKCGGADFGPDGTVDWADLKVVGQYWLDSNCAASDNCEGADLEPVGSPDGDVDFKDLAVLAQYWLETGCSSP